MLLLFSQINFLQLIAGLNIQITRPGCGLLKIKMQIECMTHLSDVFSNHFNIQIMQLFKGQIEADT